MHFAAAASTSDHGRGCSGRRRYRVRQARSPDPVRGEVEAQCGGFGRSLFARDGAKMHTHHVTFVCGNVFRRRESTQNTLAHSIMLRLSSSLDLRQTLDSFGSTHDHILFLELCLSMLHFTLPRVGGAIS